MRSNSLGESSSRAPPFRIPLVLLALGAVLLGALPFAGAVGVHPASEVPGSGPAPATSVPPTNASSEGWYHLSIHGAAPSARDDVAMTYDAKDGYVLLFGGCAKPLCPLDDTWKYQAGTWTNLTDSIGVTPAARYGAGMAYDARDGYVVMFGGMSASGVLGDTWTYEYGRWTQVATTPTTAPSPRYDAGLLYDAQTSEVILFGGDSAAGTPLADTWAFAGGVWTNLTASAGPAPPARMSAGFAYDPIDQMGILFGGSGLCGAYCSDTWGFAGGRWTNLTGSDGASAPAARSEAALAYDPGRGQIILDGGTDGAVLSDTWGFVHGVWTYLSANTSSSPGPRADLDLTFDSADNYLVAFGGHATGGLRTGTWAFLTPLSLQVVPALTTVVTGAADQFTADITGGFGLVNVTWNFGDGSAIVAGSSTGHTFFAVGSYQVIATGTDQLGVTASAAAMISVELPPLTVSISESPTAPVAGQTITFLATAAGGTAPYTYQWSGDIGGCTGATAATLSCTPTSSGDLQVSVTVVDAGHGSVVGSTALAVGAGPNGLAGHGTTASLGPSDSGLSTTFTSVYLTLAIFAACAVGVITYRAGRKREAARNGIRPLCYAVPAWSETPAEFSDPSGATAGLDDRSFSR